MLAAGYDEFCWTPQGNITSAWTGTVSVLVTGQDFASTTIAFTLSTAASYATSTATANATLNGTTTVVVNSVSAGSLAYGTVLTESGGDLPANDWITAQVSGTTGGAGTYTIAYAATGSTTESVSGSLKAGFVFIDSTCSGCDSTGSGTVTSPWNSLSKLYGSSGCVAFPSGCSTYPGAIAYLRGLNPATNYEDYDQGTHPGITLSGKNNPIAILGFPGDPNTPSIDITNLAATVSDKGESLFLYNDASDNFIQGISLVGTPTGYPPTTTNFSYLEDGYSNGRLTYDNVSIPNAYPGTNTGSGNSTTIDLEDPGSTITRSYVVLRGVNEQNRPGNFQGIGLYDAFKTNYGIAEFDTFEGSGTGGGSAYGRKLDDTYWTDRYDFSSGESNYIFWQGGFVADGLTNSYMEDCYNIIVSTGANPTTPGMAYNESQETTTNVFVYRNSVVGTGQGVSQTSTTGNGPFWFSSNAVQFGSGLTQAISFNSGSGWVGGTFPSNVSSATPTSDGVCQAAGGIFNGSNLLTGACASGYLGKAGAQIQ
jgi:hypothetical protein